MRTGSNLCRQVIINYPKSIKDLYLLLKNKKLSSLDEVDLEIINDISNLEWVLKNDFSKKLLQRNKKKMKICPVCGKTQIGSNATMCKGCHRQRYKDKLTAQKQKNREEEIASYLNMENLTKKQKIFLEYYKQGLSINEIAEQIKASSRSKIKINP